MDLSILGKFFEPEQGYYSESILQKIWHKELWKHYYKGMSGESIQILDPGFHNPVQGPDFKKARVYISGILMNGDIELHLENSDWYHHGHHFNSDYNSVILHVVFKNTDGSAYVSNERRRKVPVLYVPIEEISHLKIEQNCPKSKKDATELIDILSQQGKMRVIEKSAYFYARRRRFSFDLMFFWGLFKVCGYRYNSQNFIHLFLSIPWEEFQKNSFIKENIEALLFHLSGISPVAKDDYSKNIEKIGKDLQKFDLSTPCIEWSYTKSRPNNFPDRRLAYLAAVIGKFQGRDIKKELLAYFKDEKNIETAVKNILDAGPYPKYWENRYRLGGKSGRKIDLTPGKSLRREFLLNILYPLLNSEEMSVHSTAEIKILVKKIESTVEKVKNESLYLDAERFLKHHEIYDHKDAKKWLVSQGIIYCREHFCSVKLQALCPVCSESGKKVTR